MRLTVSRRALGITLGSVVLLVAAVLLLLAILDPTLRVGCLVGGLTCMIVGILIIIVACSEPASRTSTIPASDIASDVFATSDNDAILPTLGLAPPVELTALSAPRAKAVSFSAA